MKKRMSLTILAVVTSLWLKGALAFAPEIHEAYTLFSSMIYARACDIHSVDFAALAQELAEGAAAEDKTDIISRVSNWHFYRSEPKGLSFQRLDRVFSLRVSQLDKLLSDVNSNSHDVYRAAGRVLHYIQDMSVPAHVVPIYHGPMISDPFDHYPPPLAAILALSNSYHCASSTTDLPQSTAELKVWLDRSAKRTLERLGEWRNYWAFPVNGEFFGRYGACRFGDEKSNMDDRCHSMEAQRVLIEAQGTQVLQDSIVFIRFLKGLMDPLSNPDR